MKNNILEILYNYDKYDWSIQGFGFIRLYLDDEKIYRLHIWDSKYRIEGVSDIHNHPWNFRSTIIAGCLTNIGFAEVNHSNLAYIKQRIQTGEDAKKTADPIETFLEAPREWEHNYRQGDSYYQYAHEIHRTAATRGAITLIERTFEKDRDHADVFFPRGREWVDAKPRTATKAEVRDIMENAIANLFGDQI